MEKTLKVTGMHCKSCEILLNDVVSEISGVTRVQVSRKDGTVNVLCGNDSVLETVVKAIEAEGYKVVD